MKEKALLSSFLSEPSACKVNEWLLKHQAVLRITKPRVRKLADYSPPHNGKPHRISINQNLSSLEFQICLVHELAHLACWVKYGGKVRTHGPEWKNEFHSLLPFFCNITEFPSDLLDALNYFFQPTTSYRAGKERLLYVLHRYSSLSSDPTIEQIEFGQLFIYKGIKFRKIRKVRKRIECMRLDIDCTFSLHPLTRVKPVIGY